MGFVTAWANAPFAIAAGLAVAFALLQISGLLGVLAGDGDADHDVDQDLGDAEGDDAGDSHGDDGGGRGWGGTALASLGAGKLPFSFIWQMYALGFAVSGYALNLQYLARAVLPPLHSLAWSVPIALVAGYGVVFVTARLLGPIFSSTAQEATSRAHLVGQIGVVISSRVDESFGEVRIRDKTGHDVRVICKLPKGSRVAVPEKESVVVVDYDEEHGELLVCALGDALAEGDPKGS